MIRNKFYQKESTTTPFAEPTHYVKKTSRVSKLLIGFLIVFVLVVGSLVGLYFLGKQTKETMPITTISPTPTITTPTASPTAVLKQEDLSIVILNGSGLPGVAQQMAAHLRSKKYIVESTGNAKRFDYTGVTIMISEEKKDYLSLLQKDLEEKYKDITTSISAELKTGAEVIIGK
jgi:hypothetical protein